MEWTNKCTLLYPAVVNIIQIMHKTSTNKQGHCIHVSYLYSAHMQNCDTLPLSLINLLTTVVG